MSDATSRSLEKFSDPTAWDHVETDVPIFVAHDAYQLQKEGGGGAVVAVPVGHKPQAEAKFLYRVDDARLDVIRDEINRQYDEEGTPIRFQLGHTRLDRLHDQEAQPKSVGYGVRAKTITQAMPGGKTRKAVAVDKVYFRKGHFAEAREYPERSPEFYGFRNGITAVALLRSDPKLKMGMTIYHASQGAVHYAGGYEPMSAPPSQPVAAPQGPPAGGGQVSPEDLAKFRQFMQLAFPRLYALEAQAGQSQGPQGPPQGPPPGQQQPMSAELLAAQYQRSQAEVEATHGRLKDAEERLRLREIQGIVDDLTGKHGKAIEDPAAEVQYMASLSPVALEKRRTEILKFWPTDPSKVADVQVYQGGPVPDIFRGPANHDQVMTYMRAHPGMTYEAATAHVSGAK